MASGPETDVKILATGLAAGILLDATVVRALLVPAVVSLFGRWNWWLPAGVARVLRVRPRRPSRWRRARARSVAAQRARRPQAYAALLAGPSFASRSTPAPSSCEAVAARPLRSS